MIDWLLKGEPREAQLEALRRSWRGIATMDTLEDKDAPFERFIEARWGGRPDVPMKGWGHFAEQRIGKTPINLNEFMLFRRDFGFKWNIVIAPNAFKEDWPIEARKFGIDCDAIALESTQRRDVQKFIDKNKANGGLIAVNYEAMRSRDNLAVLEQVRGPRTLLTADESITIASHSSIIFKNSLVYRKGCGASRALSGKPISQGPHDLWAQLRFLGELDGFEFHPFRSAFCKMGGFQGKQVTGVKDPERLQKILDRCSWSPRKVDWLKTPGKDYAFRRIELSGEQQTLYAQMEEDFLIELENGTLVTTEQIVTKLNKMQQIASGFVFDNDRNVHVVVDPARNPKINTLKQMLREQFITKVIVNCVYKPSMDLLLETLKEFQPAVIRGKDWHRVNEGIIDEKARFNGDRQCRVLIGQEQALRYGHTLMGTPDDPCHSIVFYENSFSLNDRSQVEERPQGSGQTAPIGIWDFVASPRDLVTIEALQRKEDIASIVMRFRRDTGILPAAG